MRNDHIETAEIADAELDNISGGLLDGAMGQVGTTVENVLGADLGGVATDLGGLNLGGLNVGPETGLNL